MLGTDSFLSKYSGVLKNAQVLEKKGRISQVVGLVIESQGPQAPVGEVCVLRDRTGKEVCKSEIVGFKDNRILSMVLGEAKNIAPGMEIIATDKTLSIGVGNSLLGRIIDGLGQPMDGKGPVEATEVRSIYAQPPNPLLRKRIKEYITTGVRAIDGMLTLGKGQRVGIFAGSGVGKSTLLGMVARNTTADVNVIALIGERGREVRDFIEKDLGEEGLRRSVLVVATSDTPALVRVKAPLIATTIAEFFRDQGLDVMLMMDSVTRLAMAQREVGLTVGEPPTTKGYTPSVFALMPKVMERAGTSENGSITALYTVLVEGDDMNEPIADTVRGILDGHIVLSRKLAAQAHYPAIDVLESVSRVMGDVVTKQHRGASYSVREMMATYREAEDLISVGAYQSGSNPKIDKAIALNERIRQFLQQQIEDAGTFSKTIAELTSLGS
ncbi:MAG TPA: flagellar protein export ATPase FliI [Patescibacteria group bacterium]|nr:flagellar protein export ATPase FliI [Patescibacteria group bacterium]